MMGFNPLLNEYLAGMIRVEVEGTGCQGVILTHGPGHQRVCKHALERPKEIKTLLMDDQIGKEVFVAEQPSCF